MKLKIIGYSLLLISLIIGTLVDVYQYPNDVEFGVFTSFILMLLSIYILIIEDRSRKF